MEFLLTFLVCAVAGIGAGVGTGFAGMSAAAVISPMLITFLGVPAYTAVGIALASDVLASAVSAYAYGKKKNLDIGGGMVMMVSVLVFTLLSSYLAKLFTAGGSGDATLGTFSVITTFMLGIKFIIKPVNNLPEKLAEKSKAQKAVQSVIMGALIGFICGFVGAGGGMMMLFVLTSILGYELKCAVGTSVFVMTFTALTGAVSHFVMGESPDLTVLALCVIFTLVAALISAKIANKVDNKVLNRIVGVVLAVLGAVMMVMKIFG